MNTQNNLLLYVRTLAAWGVALLLFFPLGWLVLTAFKTELQAISVPPLLFFTPTMENFSIVQERSDYLLYAQNSLITSVASTILGLALVFPAAYSMAPSFRVRTSSSVANWSRLLLLTRPPPIRSGASPRRSRSTAGS